MTAPQPQPHPTPEEIARKYLDSEGRFQYGETTELAVANLAVVIRAERCTAFERALEILRETYPNDWEALQGYDNIKAEMEK